MSKRRAWLVWSLIVLASIVTLVSSLTIWSKRQLLSTDNWVDSSGKLLTNDEIRGALATKLADLSFERTDAVAQLQQRLPKQTQGAAPVIASALQTTATRAVNTLLATPKAQQLWENANRAAHERMVAILEEKQVGAISADTGAITLDLRPLIEKLDGRLGLKDRVGASGSEQTGQIVLVESDQLETAQNAVSLIKHLSVWVAVAALALYALAIYLAHGRRRKFLQVTGASLVFVGLAILIIRRIVGNVLVDSLVNTQANRPPVKAMWLIETDLLRDIGLALLLYGTAAFVAGLLAGPSRVAVGARRLLVPSFRDHVVGVYATAALLFLLFIAWGPTAATQRLVGVAILGALIALGIEIWRRQTLREFPAAPGVVTPAASADAAEKPSGTDAVPH